MLRGEAEFLFYQAENGLDFLRMPERKVLQPAGKGLHHDAVAKAKLEYQRFATHQLPDAPTPAHLPIP